MKRGARLDREFHNVKTSYTYVLLKEQIAKLPRAAREIFMHRMLELDAGYGDNMLAMFTASQKEVNGIVVAALGRVDPILQDECRGLARHIARTGRAADAKHDAKLNSLRGAAVQSARYGGM